MLSHQEIVDRSIRLNPNLPVNRYTGTLNDPIQEAQSRYMGPRWDQFFGSLAKNQEDAQLAGKNYRVGWGGFGNGVSTQESDMPSRRSSAYASLPGARALDGDHEDLARGIAWNDYVAQSKEQDARQRILNSQASVAEEQARQAALPRESDAEMLDRTLAPPMSRELLSKEIGAGGSPDKYTLRPDPTQSPRDRFLASVPGHLRPQVEAQFAASDAKAEANRIDAAKLDETIRKDKATEAAATPFKPVTDEKGAPVTGMAVLDKLSPDVQATVKAVLEGRQALPTGTATKDPYWKGIIGLANQADPSFDAVNYNARNKAFSDFSSQNGAGGKTINALNTAVNHIAKLSDLVETLDNFDTPVLNSVRNPIESALGSTKVTNFNAVQPQAMKEIERLWRGAGGSEGEINKLKDSLSPNMGKQQQREALASFADLMMGKLESTQEQRDSALGPIASKRVPILFDKSREALQKIYQRSGATPPPMMTKASEAGGGDTVKLLSPDGKTTRDVPADQVDHYLAQGAKRVGG